MRGRSAASRSDGGCRRFSPYASSGVPYADASVDSSVADDDATPTTLREIHRTAMERFRLAEAAYREQSERELKDIKFAARIGQWTEAERANRAGQNSTSGLLNARPCLTIDKLRQPIQQLENQQRSANLAVNVHPKGGGANKKTAEILQGLYRNIQVESRADQIARFWAYSRALKAGRGFYRIEKVYAHEQPEDETSAFDQELRISRILNQAGVLLDPFAQEPDWCDGEWAFVKAWVPATRYAREHERSELANCDDDVFTTIGTTCPGWI